MTFTAWFSIIVGILMIGQWGFFISAGQVPELKTEPLSIAFHLAAEVITALMLIISGSGILMKTYWAKTASLLALGMLTYTVIVSPGYFAQQGVWAQVAIFVLLFILTTFSILQHFSKIAK
jgi:hypothetical protein